MTQQPMLRKSRTATAQGRHKPGGRKIHRANERRIIDGRPDSYAVTESDLAEVLIEALPDMKRLASVVEKAKTSNRGAKPHYPDWVGALTFGGLHTGSQRMAVSVIASRWADVRRAAAIAFPDDAPLRAIPPRRWHWRYWSETNLFPNMDRFGDEFTKLAIEQARIIGMLNPDEPFKTQPNRNQVVTADVKYYTAPSKFTPETSEYEVEIIDETTGEVTTETKHHRYDPASQFSKKGGETEYTWGTPFQTLAVRNDEYHERIILTINYRQKGCSEGQLLINEADHLHDEGVDPQAFDYDGALAGTHIDALTRRGYLVASPVTALVAGDDDGVGRVEKSRRLNIIEGKSKKCSHDLWGVGGHLCLKIRRHVGGETPWINLNSEPKRRVRETKVSGRYYDWYGFVRIPCKHGEALHNGQRVHEHYEPLTEQPGDAEKGINRAEYVRQHAPGSPGYKAVYPWRVDIESGHSHVDRSMWGGIVGAYGATRQRAMLLGYALGANLLAVHIAAHSADPPKPVGQRAA